METSTFCETFGSKYGKDFTLHKENCKCKDIDNLETRGLTENYEAEAIIKQIENYKKEKFREMTDEERKEAKNKPFNK